MSKDFSPQICWHVNARTVCKDMPYGVYLMNYKWVIDGKESIRYTDEELEDRKKHKYLAVTGADIYDWCRKNLTEEQFEGLNKSVEALVEEDLTGKKAEGVADQVRTWYFNRNNHYYHEPNDAEFMEYLDQIRQIY